MKPRVLIASVLALSCAAAMAAPDKFNRTDLGSDWTVVSGSLWITDNQLAGDLMSLGTFAPAANKNAGSVLVQLNGVDTQYGAVTIGDAASGMNAFVKIQTQNGAGTFSHGAFYVGNNGGGAFFSLDGLPASSSARLTARVNGTIATMEIDTDNDGTPEATYSYDYGMTFANGVGLGTYGAVTLDNLKTRTLGAPTQRIAAPRLGGEADMSR